MKTALNSSFCAVTADSKLRWPHGKKAYFRGVNLMCQALRPTQGISRILRFIPSHARTWPGCISAQCTENIARTQPKLDVSEGENTPGNERKIKVDNAELESSCECDFQIDFIFAFRLCMLS